MKKILFYTVLTISAAGLVSCSTITKNTPLEQNAIKCGTETTVWESLPASEHNAYDVTVSFSKTGACPRNVVVQKKDGTSTMSNITSSKPQTFTGVTKIVLKCTSSELAVGDQCAFTVNDVERSPTNAATTITITNIAAVTVPCGTTAVGFTSTNTTGADVTVLWQSSPPCNATITAIRAGSTPGKTITNSFPHDIHVDKELSTIQGVLKLTFACDGAGGASSGCTFQVVETEYP